MRVVLDEKRLAGSYALKFQIIKEIEQTERDMSGDETFIPAIGTAMIEELSKQLDAVEKRIDEKWDEAERSGDDVAIQGTFGFYWNCQIDGEEIPF